MKYMAIMIILLVTLGCAPSSNPIQSFKGPVTSLKIGGIQVECSAAVKRKAEGTEAATEEGYPCLVLMTKNTGIKRESGESLKLQTFRELAREKRRLVVKVVITEEQVINKEQETREMVAEKIILLE